jgi:ribokinase
VQPPPARPRADPGSLGVVGALSLDSVIGQDGRPLVGKTGGNALWSSLAAWLCGARPRVVSVVGSDYPTEVVERIAAAGIDTSAVTRIDRAHPVRVTFAHLPGGGRLQPVPAELLAGFAPEVRAAFVDTTGQPDVLPLGTPEPSAVPAAWLDEVDSWHLPLAPLHRHRALVGALAGAAGRLQSDCPARSDLLGDPIGRLAPTLGRLDTFLPSTSDLDVVCPGRPWPGVLAALRAAGARQLVLKAGPAGSFVLPEGDAVWRVPAVPVEVVDPTGAGDAFCGGFAAALARTGDPVTAAAWGAAVASVAVGVTDPLALLDVDPAQVAARAARAATTVTRVPEAAA